MKRTDRDQEMVKVVRLLETLRHESVVVNVDTAVRRRIALIGAPGRAAAPLISLRQFGWAAATAVLGIVLGALCLAGTVAPGAGGSTASTTLSGMAIRAASALLSVILGLARGWATSALHSSL